MIALDLRLIKPVMLTSIFQKIGTYSLARIATPLEQYCSQALDAQYKSEGRRSNSQWRELKESTLAQKLALGYGNKQILEREGDLEASIKGIKLQLRASSLFGTFSGKHAGLIDKFNGDRPLIVFIDEDRQKINSIIFKDLVTYLGFRN